jgi:hypothetical protein
MTLSISKTSKESETSGIIMKKQLISRLMALEDKMSDLIGI